MSVFIAKAFEQPSRPSKCGMPLIRGVCYATAVLWFSCALCYGQFDPAAEYLDRDEIRRSTDDILDSFEFRNLQRLRAKLDEAETTPADDEKPSDNSEREEDRTDSEGWNPPAGLRMLAESIGVLFHGIAWIAIAIVCGLIVYLIITAVRNFERRAEQTNLVDDSANQGEAEPEHAPGELAAVAYLRRGRELAAAGNYREAVAQLVLGAMSHIERAGMIRFRRGLTYRDYLRAARGNEPVHRSFHSLVRLYEPLGFGRRDADRDYFERSLSGYEEGFGATQTAMDR